MPPARRGRHRAPARGRSRQFPTRHLTTVLGTVAVAAAAAGALTIGGPGSATVAAAGPVDGSQARISLAPTDASVLNAAAVQARRDQERIERGTQRDQVAAGAAASVEERAAHAERLLDSVTADRLARFAGPTYALPVTGYSLTSMYGPRWGTMHTGVDLAAPWGTEIHAISSGTIIFAARDGGCGNKMIIQQDDGAQVWYCHQSRFALTSGYVRTGDLIGYVGSTGNSTGPHLHVEVHPGGGDSVNPRTWFLSHGIKL